MRAVFVIEQFANESALSEWQKPLVIRKRIKGIDEVVFPVGTIFEGEHAIRICRTGQGRPDDAECADACGMNAQQLAEAQINCKMNCLGVNRREDRELFRAGVIAGYDDKLNYLPGPNWDKYQEAKRQLAKQEEEI